MKNLTIFEDLLKPPPKQPSKIGIFSDLDNLRKKYLPIE
jgi:hypothetical protein